MPYLCLPFQVPCLTPKHHDVCTEHRFAHDDNSAEILFDFATLEAPSAPHGVAADANGTVFVVTQDPSQLLRIATVREVDSDTQHPVLRVEDITKLVPPNEVWLIVSLQLHAFTMKF